MRYSLVFRIKGELKYIFHDDKDVLLLVAASFDLCHVPYQMFDRRTLLINHSEG
jgi:hypothetical protein